MNQAKPFPITKLQVWEAYKRVKANKGGAGVDGQTLQAFEEDLGNNLYKLWNRMASGSYMPPPVRRVEIPKANGGIRPLGIPTVVDRVSQMVVKQTLEPELERHFHPDSYGYRPGKSALDAVDITRTRCWRFDWVVEFDIKGLFDHIDHTLLLRALKKHVQCEWAMLYIGRWLTAPLQHADGTRVERTRGTPQGGVVSPVLANLFLHYAFDVWMTRTYPDTPWCRYADDGLVHCRTEHEAQAIKAALDVRLLQCGLQLHPDKTKIVYCKDGQRKGTYPNTQFDFLGYTFRPRLVKNRKRNSMFVNFTPAVSKMALKSMRQTTRKLNFRNWTNLSLAEIARLHNPVLRGWLNYYQKYTPSALNWFFHRLNERLVKWVRKTFKRFRTSEMKALGWLQEAARGDPGLFAHWKGGHMPEAATRMRRAV